MEKVSKINVFRGRERGTKSKNQILTGSKGADTQNISALFLLCGFTLLSTVACETQNHPLCGCALIVIQKMSHSFYNSKCSSHYCKERNDSLWLIKQMNCLIQNGCASTISYSPQSIDEKLYLINIVKV